MRRTSMSVGVIRRLQTSKEMTRRNRSRSLTTTMPNLRDIAVDSSLVMLAFLNTDSQRHRIKFGEPLHVCLKDDKIPTALLELLKHMNDKGVDIPDVFRRPGNTTEQKKLIKRLTDGKPVKFSDYNFYTLASVIKRFLLCIPGGILGEELETKALTVLYLEDRVQQLQTLHHIISSLRKSVQHLLSFLFGLWYRIAQREHIHQMSAEAMAKSVTGSIFVNTTSDPRLVKNAAKVMELMIENFTCPLLFGEENLQFFSEISLQRDGLSSEHSSDRQLTNHLQDETDREVSDGTNSNRSVTLPHIDEIKLRQLDRMKQRTAWFLANNRSADSSPRSARHHTRTYQTRQTFDVFSRSHSTSSDSSSGTGEDNT